MRRREINEPIRFEDLNENQRLSWGSVLHIITITGREDTSVTSLEIERAGRSGASVSSGATLSTNNVNPF